MSASDREPAAADRLADALAEFDEALAAGMPEATELNFVELDDEGTAQLEREKECVRLLRSLWPSSPSPRDAVPDLPGTSRIGRFEVRRVLGRGGFGTVFLAFDRLLGREVALKMPRPAVLSSAEMRRRFFREVRAAAGLNHPNIVTVHEAGEWGTVGYLIAAYIAGPTLAQWMRDRKAPVPVRQAASLVSELADAVEHAHQRGVLHRDIKPGNVLLAPAPTSIGERPGDDLSFGFIPKLTDFGLARLVESTPDETRTGALLGTPRYMAPEQAMGQHDRVGPPTDVHALGVLLYELLAGRPPYVGESDLETMVAVAHSEPVPLGRGRAGMPRDLETICQQCLAKSPGARYRSAGELSADLRRFLAHEPIKARPLGPVARTLKWARRKPALASIVLVGLLSLAGFLGGGIYYTANLEHARRVAEQRGREALERARTIRHHVYAAEMQLASHAYRNGNQSQLMKILEGQRPAETDEDLRGFEWHYLWRLCHRERLTLRGHRGDVYCVTFSPDGRFLVTAGQDRIVRIWDVDRGTLRRTFEGHEDEIGSVSFAPDGSRVVTVASDRTIRNWEFATGRQIARWYPPGGLVGCALYLPDGRTLATGSRDGRIQLLDSQNGQVRSSLQKAADLIARTYDASRKQPREIAQTARILALALSADGQWLVVFREDGAGQMWNLATRSVQYVLPRRGDSINGVTFSPDSASFATAGADGTVEIWDSATGFRTASIAAHESATETVAYSPDGRLLASAGRDAAVRLWALPGGSAYGELRGHTSIVWSVAFSPDGRTLATAGGDAEVKLWDVCKELDHQTLVALDGSPILSIAAAPDSTVVAASRQNRGIEWLKLDRDLSLRAFAQVPQARANQVSYAPDGSLLAAACEDGVVRLFGPERGEELGMLRGQDSPVYCLAFSADGKTLAAGGGHGNCVLWNVRKRQRLLSIVGHTADVTGMAFFPGDKMIATSSRDKSVRLWDVATGGQRNLLQHGSAVQSIALAANGNILAAAEDRSLSVWQRERDGRWTGPFMHPINARSVSIDAKSKKPIVAIVGGDHSLRAFRLDSPGELTDVGLNGRSRLTSCAAFVPDGRTVVTGDLNGSVTVWNRNEMRPRASRPAMRVGGGPLSFSADGRLLAIGGLTGSVDLYRPANRTHSINLHPFPDAPITNLAVSPGGELLVATTEGATRFWSQGESRWIVPPWGDRQDVLAIAISGGGSFIVAAFGSGGPKTQIEFWSLKNNRFLGRLPEQPTCDCPRLAIAPGDTLLATAIGNVATVWDIPTQKSRTVLPVHNGRIARIAFSPDGQILATAGETDRTVRLFDVADLGQTRMTFANSASVTALGFTGDSRTLAVAGRDGKLRLFNVATGQEMTTLEAHSGGVEDLAFAPDGSLLVTSGKSKEGAGEVFLWLGSSQNARGD